MAYDRLDYGYMRMPGGTAIGDWVSIVGAVQGSVGESANIELFNWPIASAKRKTWEVTVQVEDTTSGEIESFKGLVQTFALTECNWTEWAIIFTGSARIGEMGAEISGETCKIYYTNQQSGTVNLIVNFKAEILESDA